MIVALLAGVNDPNPSPVNASPVRIPAVPCSLAITSIPAAARISPPAVSGCAPTRLTSLPANGAVTPIATGSTASWSPMRVALSRPADR